MYFGSVKFFKHLIYFIIALIMILAVVGVIAIASWCSESDSPNEEASVSEVDDNYNIGNDENDITDDNNEKLGDDGENEKYENTDENSAVSECKDDRGDEITDATGESGEGDEIADTNGENDTTGSSSTTNTGIAGKVAYLTIDSSPTEDTEDILDFLDEQDVKATFFIVTGNKKDLDILNDILDRGHSIGLRSDCDIFSEVYNSVDDFMKDIKSESDIIYEITKTRPMIVRMPGGSVNDYNEEIYEDIINELVDGGYKIFDWNVSLQDAQDISSETMLENADKSYELSKDGDVMILSHDTIYTDRTLIALDKFIEELKNDGYTFSVLNENVESLLFMNK